MKDNMTLNKYQIEALKTSIPTCESYSYLALAICGEAGEVAEKIKKVIRDKNGQFFSPDLTGIALELGDVLWYLSVMAKKLGFTLEEIANLNLEKIKTRIEHGTLHGSGDKR